MAAPVKLVKDQLVQHAELAVVGESPGKEEIFTGQPFVGPSGSLLNNFLFTAGLRRTDVAVLNVSQRRPSFKSDDIKLIPRDELEVWKESLRHRLTLLPNLKVVVPLGNTALEAVLGSKAKLSKNKSLSISKAAGFYYENVELEDGRKVLVIPVYHPAATFRDQTLVKVCEEIWQKIGAELKRGLVAETNTLGPLLDDTFKIEAIPHPDDALDYAYEVTKLGAEAPPISFDIETPRDVPREKILCVGFSHDGKFGMTIPFDDHRAVGPKEWREKYQEAIRIIVTSEVPKLGQNLLFDTFMLTRLKGMWVPNVVYDTRMMHLCLSGDTKVLTEDLRWVRLDQLQIGDRLVSFEEEAPGGHRRLISSVVEDRSVSYKPTLEVEFSNGTTLRGTRDHRILVGRVDNCGRANGGVWKELHELQEGDIVWSIGQPWESLETYDAGWIAGLFDGEGHTGRQLNVSVAQKEGPILDQAEYLLANLGFKTKAEKQTRATSLYIRGGIAESLRFLGSIRPQRMLAQAVKRFRSTGASDAQRVRGAAKVASIKAANACKVYDIQTSSRTFIANGILVHNCWDPRREHSLSSMVAHMFRARMWKDREEDSRVNDDYGTLAEYCAQDALRTWHVAMWIKQRLENEGLWHAYDSIYRRRFYPLLRISLHGLAINQKARHEIHEELEKECEELRAELAGIAGVPLSGGKTLEDAKSLSDRKVSEFLYGPKDPPAPAIKLTKTGKVAKNQPPAKPKGLALKPIIDKDTGKPTSNEVALKTLRLRVEGKDERAAKGIDLILAHREKHQMSTFVVPERVDRDHRFRSSFGFAETGRLTSSANPIGTGANAQNASRAIRRIFIPDPGCVFVSVDLSCVEDRIIKCYSKDPELIRLARLPSYEYDAHSDLAAKIFNIPIDQVTKEHRYMGKKVRHSSQRNVKGQRFADELLKEGTVRTKAWCDRVLEAYHISEPGIRAGYFPYVTELVMKNKELVSPWGYRVSYRGERVDDDLLREAFSFLPQAGAVFTLDLQGFIAVDDLIEAEVLKSSRINNEVHDSVTVSCPLDEAYHVAKFLVTSLSQPNDFDGVELSVPAEAKVGASLDDKDSNDWKKFPTKEEFDKVAEKWLEVANQRHRDHAEFVKTMPKVTYGKKKSKKKSAAS